MAKSINDIPLGNKSIYQGFSRKGCENQKSKEWNNIKDVDFVKIKQKLERGDAEYLSTTNKRCADNYNNVWTKSDVISIKNNNVNKYQVYGINNNENKLDRNMISFVQRRPRTKNTSIDKNYTTSNSGKNKKDNITHSHHTKSAENNTKSKTSPLINEIHCYFKNLLSSNKSNKHIRSEKDIFLYRKVNNDVKQKKSSIIKACKNSITNSKRGNITSNALDEFETKIKANSEHKDQRQLQKFESKINTISDEHRQGENVNLDKYINHSNYIQDYRNVNFTSNEKNIIEVFPRYVEKKNPFQFKLKNDMVCFFVNLKGHKDCGMCLEWPKKQELQDNRKCKKKSKSKNKCVNYEKQLKVAISDDCAINNSLYQRTKQYFKDIGSKFTKCFMSQKSPAHCYTLNDCCHLTVSKSNSNITCDCNLEKQKTPSKGSVELENKKSLLKQNRSCNTFQCCKSNCKLRLIKTIQNLFKSKNCDPEVYRKNLNGSIFQIKIDPVNMKVINKREVKKKIKLQNKNVKKNCNPSKAATSSVIKGKAYFNHQISPHASDCKGPLFEIKLDRNNMRILNLSEILHKIRRLECCQATNNCPKSQVQNKIVNKCDPKQLRDIKSKISCLWTQFMCTSENTAFHHKNNYNAKKKHKKTFAKKRNHHRTHKKVMKSNSNKKSKIRKKKHKRKKPKPVHKKKIKKPNTRRAKQHKKKVKNLKHKNEKIRHKRIMQERKRDKRKKAKIKKKKDKCRRLKKKKVHQKLKKKHDNTCCTELSKFLADFLFCISKNSKSNKCKKPAKRRRKRCEHIKYHCKVGHLRKSEISCMWLYIVCPSLYPGYLFFRSMLRNLRRLLLIMLALILLCPFVLLFELFRVLCLLL